MNLHYPVEKIKDLATASTIYLHRVPTISGFSSFPPVSPIKLAQAMNGSSTTVDKYTLTTTGAVNIKAGFVGSGLPSFLANILCGGKFELDVDMEATLTISASGSYEVPPLRRIAIWVVPTGSAIKWLGANYGFNGYESDVTFFRVAGTGYGLYKQELDINDPLNTLP